MEQDSSPDIKTGNLFERSYKGTYRFRLGTTSFIYRTNYQANVARLGKYLDEIELLFFEMPPGGRVDPELVRDLAALADKLELTYNLHLPLDLGLAAENPALRRQDTDLTARLINSSRALPLSSYTLHVNHPSCSGTPSGPSLGRWRKLASESIADVLETTGLPPSMISVENLAYPFQWIAPLVDELGLAICLDVGHLVANGQDVKAALDVFGQRTTVVHLYGTGKGQDHGALSLLPPAVLGQVAAFLKTFNGSLMLEVFRPDDLRISLSVLAELL